MLQVHSLKPPNIVLFVADDLGVGEVGLWQRFPSKRRTLTPEIDKLGREGMRFTDAYAGYTVCAPSRTTLFTGYHSGSFIRKGINGMRLSSQSDDLGLLPQMLQKAGYQTCLVGKSAPLIDPIRAGFDYFIGQVDQAVCHNMYPSKLDFMNGRANIYLPMNKKQR